MVTSIKTNPIPELEKQRPKLAKLKLQFYKKQQYLDVKDIWKYKDQIKALEASVLLLEQQLIFNQAMLTAKHIDRAK